MKTIFHSELNDEQRNKLAQIVDGKSTARLASRKDVISFLEGVLARALAPEPVPLQSGARASTPLSTPPQYLLDAAKQAGLSINSYLAGWNNPGFGAAAS